MENKNNPPLDDSDDTFCAVFLNQSHHLRATIKVHEKCTPLKINISPKKGPFQKEHGLPSIISHGDMGTFSGKLGTSGAIPW